MDDRGLGSWLGERPYPLIVLKTRKTFLVVGQKEARMPRTKMVPNATVCEQGLRILHQSRLRKNLAQSRMGVLILNGGNAPAP